MTTLGSLARFVHDFELERLSADTLERLELHLLDTLGALRAGAELEEAKAIAALERERGSFLLQVATIRATEIDDIHLASCTTPGSVVVPTALSLSFDSPQAFLSALAVGYELMIRLGLAIDGPRALARGVWPTLYSAPLGSAAVAARAFGLSVERTSGALATALALTTGTATGPRSPSTSRWLTLGWAAESGVLAAKAACIGVLGTRDLPERLNFRVAGSDVSKEDLLDGLGELFRIDELSLKPYPVARQALAAVEACRELAGSHELEPSAIDEIRVSVPAPQRAVIDHPDVPETRFLSIVSVQYQSALAIAAPERLLDIGRDPLFLNDGVKELMSRVRVEPDAELDHHYPAIWPARVTLRSGSERFERESLRPRGDAGTDFGWDAVAAKYQRNDPFVRDELVPRVRGLHKASALPGLGSDD